MIEQIIAQEKLIVVTKLRDHEEIGLVYHKYHKVKLEDIALRLNVSRRTIYNWFEELQQEEDYKRRNV